MMIQGIRDIKSGKRELRQFGITIGVVLGLLCGLLLLRGKAYYPYFLAISVTFIVLGLTSPTLLKPVQKIWMAIAILIGHSITGLILILLYYLVVTPIGILAKVFGKKFLDLKLSRDADSYWIEKATVKFDKRRYEQQF